MSHEEEDTCLLLASDDTEHAWAKAAEANHK